MATKYPKQVEALKRLQKVMEDVKAPVDPARRLPKYHAAMLEGYFDKFHKPGGQGNFGREKYYKDVANRLADGHHVNWDALTALILEENTGVVFTP